MTDRPLRNLVVLAGLALAGACSSAARSAEIEPQPEATATTAHIDPDSAAIAKARADSMRYPYTEADVQFMTNMVGHHAQAIEMSKMAPTHTDNKSIHTLAGRIINAQKDEIAIMQQWLRDRRRPVPDPSSGMHGAGDAGHHGALAPGMLTPEQMKKLDEARGPEFDRLFLTFMIQHHRGAVAMVKELFSTYGAGHDEIVFKLASDVNVDQTTEIDRMQLMLAEMMFEDPSR
jgi:uncharacterized protein (DUF305 family)